MMTDSRMTSNRDTKSAPGMGFTLVDMLIVIVVMGLIMSILAPTLTGATASVGARDAAHEAHSFS